MSGDALIVPEGEHGRIRVFALDMRPEQAEFLREPGAADQVLGLAGLDPAQIDVIRIADLEGLGLTGYLTEGCGLTEEQILPDRALLEGLEGYVLVLRSRAFQGAAAVLAPDPEVRLIASYDEPDTDWRAEPVRSASAEPYSAPRSAPRAARARARRIGGGLFAVVMILIALLIWAVAV
ncbi:hypothetical protein [Antarcticimicrobium luteum]|uniref:Uncharacterized protein n=1 Tax=Antarcticimicrobium luteum TaxID=2547397 RepID=A0A4R5UWW3_9RHOB|nr:hypothetical protein [Antarcticimicrobium luteum]TDK43769.1 hypothetical protein E1832_15945 [Antarcticimicrobium luteum]